MREILRKTKESTLFQMAFLNLELMREQNKVAFPNYSGSFEKTLLQDFQKVAE